MTACPVRKIDRAIAARGEAAEGSVRVRAVATAATSRAAALQARRLDKGKADFERLSGDARRNKRRDTWELVIRELESAVAAAPKGARAVEAAALAGRAREELWLASRRKEDAVAAIEAYRRVDEAAPGSPDAAAALSRAVNVARRIGDPETAASIARRLVARYPGTEEASSAAAVAGFAAKSLETEPQRKPPPAAASIPAVAAPPTAPDAEEAAAAASRLLDRVIEAARKGAAAVPGAEEGAEEGEEAELPPEPEAPEPVGSVIVQQAVPPSTEPDGDRPEKVERARELRSAVLASKAGSLSDQLGLRIRRIVVDAGHGGRDTGALGPKGTREKDVALAIAKVLAVKLKTLGFAVILTRQDDRYLTLDERTRIANDARADLFVSIHCNAARRRKLAGIETWTLNVASNRYAARLASFENADADRSASDLRLILADLATRANADDSRDIAQSVQSALVRAMRSRGEKVTDHGIKHALFYVLLGARMPAILVETGFISNPAEEARLRSRERQHAAADAIAAGVREFADGRRRIARFP
jgi:N-acetylmuramoyl-L-alanine amidase